ncbi:MAG: hypothetical protein AAFY72_11995 [Cyanobacteria bacterium J06649_4]
MSKLLSHGANRVDLDQWRYYYNQLLFVDTPLSADFICDERSAARLKPAITDVEALTAKVSDDLTSPKRETAKKVKGADSSISDSLASDGPQNKEVAHGECLTEVDATLWIASSGQENVPSMKIPNIHARAFLNSCDACTNFIGCTTVVDLFPIGIATSE